MPPSHVTISPLSSRLASATHFALLEIDLSHDAACSSVTGSPISAIFISDQNLGGSCSSSCARVTATNHELSSSPL
eukprot:CAMPEP_0115881864 /NCGR_PEP_ID=MMETSP0287-20121206/28684_1 /TAXON_ID=412157 /ORGANISM="Chrysochromulina rotalis, Strain UIO044" /LENGTH=75 /DNA_ID=CAMNT_0003337875 /DNA_START=278 /DNA_END=505 /DNA_ORIENTATION=-